MNWLSKKPKPVPIKTAGYAVINGFALPLVQVELRDGQIKFYFERLGPCKLEGPITVFGADDVGMFQGSWVPEREIAPNQGVTVPVSLRVNSIDDNHQFAWRDGYGPH